MLRNVFFKIKVRLLYGFIAVVLLCHKGLIRIIPFKHLVKWYANDKVNASGGVINMGRVGTVRRIFDVASNRLFWKPNCFEQALTALFIARLFKWPCTVNFGIQKGEQSELMAHAWSEIASVELTGHGVKAQYVSVFKMQYTP